MLYDFIALYEHEWISNSPLPKFINNFHFEIMLILSVFEFLFYILVEFVGAYDLNDLDPHPLILFFTSKNLS